MTDVKPSRPRRLANDQCPFDAEALERGVSAIERLAATAEKLLPAAQAIEELNIAQDKLCAWLKRWGPWVLGLAPVILSAAGAMSPEVATKLIAAISTLASG